MKDVFLGFIVLYLIGFTLTCSVLTGLVVFGIF